MHLFVYGTLRDLSLVRSLTGRAFASEPAVLPDFERVEPPGAYPFVVARLGHQVDGRLLCDLDAAALAALDAYEDEGRLYRREQVSVRLADGRMRECFTYVGLAVAPRPA